MKYELDIGSSENTITKLYRIDGENRDMVQEAYTPYLLSCQVSGLNAQENMGGYRNNNREKCVTRGQNVRNICTIT